MVYQKIINLLDNTTNQSCKFRTRNWVEINDESQGKYRNSSIKFKTLTIRSDLCNYSDVYILVTGSITITGAGDDDNAKRTKERNKGVIFTYCTPFTNCISSMYNIHRDNAEYIDIVMPMYNLVEHSGNY